MYKTPRVFLFPKTQTITSEGTILPYCAESVIKLQSVNHFRLVAWNSVIYGSVGKRWWLCESRVSPNILVMAMMYFNTLLFVRVSFISGMRSPGIARFFALYISM